MKYFVGTGDNYSTVYTAQSIYQSENVVEFFGPDHHNHAQEYADWMNSKLPKWRIDDCTNGEYVTSVLKNGSCVALFYGDDRVKDAQAYVDMKNAE